MSRCDHWSSIPAALSIASNGQRKNAKRAALVRWSFLMEEYASVQKPYSFVAVDVTRRKMIALKPAQLRQI
jgi:hypothetical protein